MFSEDSIIEDSMLCPDMGNGISAWFLNERAADAQGEQL